MAARTKIHSEPRTNLPLSFACMQLEQLALRLVWRLCWCRVYHQRIQPDKLLFQRTQFSINRCWDIVNMLVIWMLMNVSFLPESITLLDGFLRLSLWYAQLVFHMFSVRFDILQRPCIFCATIFRWLYGASQRITFTVLIISILWPRARKYAKISIQRGNYSFTGSSLLSFKIRANAFQRTLPKRKKPMKSDKKT